MDIYEQTQRIASVLKYIDKNLHTSLDVRLLAEISGWSRWQLQRVFSAHTGLSVAQYVRQLRLALAAWKLLHSNDRQLDIALFCGFDSEVSFSRSFKKHFGCPPRDYRQAGLLIGIGGIFEEKIAMHHLVKCSL
jgi:AraC family transcriptional regulator